MLDIKIGEKTASANWHRREPKGVWLKGGLHFYVFPLTDASSLASTCSVQVEAFLVHCPLFAGASIK